MTTDKKIPLRQDSTPESDAFDEGFLARWSRRKQSAHEAKALDAPAKAKADAPTPPADEPLPVEHEAAAPKTDVDMPPIESLNEHSDYSQFLSSGVSEELRRLALRKLFHLPWYNVRDGLDDYALDYTKFTPLGNIITSDMRLQFERLAEKLDRPIEELMEEFKATGEIPRTEVAAGAQTAAEQSDVAASDAKGSAKEASAEMPGGSDPKV